jgi:hypothetical protein
MESVVQADEPGLAKTFSRQELIRLLGPLLEPGREDARPREDSPSA